MMQTLIRLAKALVLAAALPFGCAQTTAPTAGNSAAPSAVSGKTEVLWLGQSAFRITTPGGKVIVTDPWLQQNPITPAKYKT